VLRDFMDSVGFVRMSPAASVLRPGAPEGASALVLAASGREYALYLHHGRERSGRGVKYAVDPAPEIARLSLDLPAGSYRAEWIDTKNGKVAKREDFSHGGGPRTLASPQYSEDIALRVRAR
jgi:hypothetical protein